jgi:hypothetical protein
MVLPASRQLSCDMGVLLVFAAPSPSITALVGLVHGRTVPLAVTAIEYGSGDLDD